MKNFWKGMDQSHHKGIQDTLKYTGESTNFK